MSQASHANRAAGGIALLILSIALRPPIVSIGPVLESIQKSFRDGFKKPEQIAGEYSSRLDRQRTSRRLHGSWRVARSGCADDENYGTRHAYVRLPIDTFRVHCHAQCGALPEQNTPFVQFA